MNINDYREAITPKDAIKIVHKATGAVAYLYETIDRPCAMVFRPKAKKPTWRFYFNNEAQREKRVSSFFEAVEDRQNRTKARRKEANEAGRGVEVGDILRSSWGYDQTNIDYYEVTAIIGKRTVEIREIAQERFDTEWMQGKCSPLPGSYTSEPIRKQARDGYVKISSCQHAYKVEPTVVGGVKTYGTDHWTSYA